MEEAAYKNPKKIFLATAGFGVTMVSLIKISIQKDGLGDYSVWSILEDKIGHIWVGTRNNGLYRYDG